MSLIFSVAKLNKKTTSKSCSGFFLLIYPDHKFVGIASKNHTADIVSKYNRLFTMLRINIANSFW
ncbi:Uncharacterised protein, partial [Mycoplasma putrefaciens]